MLSRKSMTAAMYAVVLAVLAYLGYAVYDAGKTSVQTVLVSEGQVEETAEMTGWVFREEEVLTAPGMRITVICPEGQRLCAGEAYAVRDADGEAKERVSERTALTERIACIRQVLREDKHAADRAPDAARTLAALAATGDLAALDEATLAVETYILAGSTENEDALRTTLTSLETELSLLNETMQSDALSVCVEKAGYYSAHADGYEAVNLGSEMPPPTALEAMMAQPEQLSADTAGKLVTGIRWRYAAIVDEETAGKLSAGDRVAARFAGYFQGTVTMTVENLGLGQAGRQVVLLSCTEHLDDMLTARRAEGELLLTSFSGIRIPADGVYRENGETVVYVVEGVQAKRKTVELLGEREDAVYVAPGDLQPGMEIVVGEEDLFDGKVVR